MRSSKEKAAEFRRQAALCREVAERYPSNQDRAETMERADRLLELARRAETETDEASSN